MSFTVLELVGEQVTIDLLDGVNYALTEWAPAVAARNKALMGGYSPYSDVTERLRVNVYGGTVGGALQALDDIAAVLEQAEAWVLGDATEPVIMRVQLAGSSLSEPLEAVVLGQTGGDSLMTLQPTFNEDILLYEIVGVEIQLLRRGLWLGPVTDKTMKGSAANPAVMSIDMDSVLRRLSPTAVHVTGFGANTPMIGGGFLVVSGVSPLIQSGQNIAIFNAAAMSATGFTLQTDAPNHARGGDVLRIDAAVNTSGTLSIGSVNTDVSRVSVFAAVRNNSTDVAWEAQAISTGYVTINDDWKIIDTSSQHPRVMHIGTLSNQSGSHSHIRLDFRTSGATGTLDVNYVAIVGHDASTNVVAIMDGDYSEEAFARALVVDPRAMSHRTPLLYIETVSV